MSGRGTWEPIGALLRMLEQTLDQREVPKEPPCTAEDLRALETAAGAPLPASWRAFLEQRNGATLREGVRVLSASEAVEARDGSPEGLVPVLREDDSLVFLDVESVGASGEWPAVTVVHGQTEPAGTTFLRFLLAYMAETPKERTECDPEHAAHWIELVSAQAMSGDREGAWHSARQALLAARPVGPALWVVVAEEAIRQELPKEASFYFERALDAEIFSLRDEEARYDAAAELFTLAKQDGDEAQAMRCRELLGEGLHATAAVWREEALSALGGKFGSWATHAARVVLALVPEDADASKILEPSSMVQEAAQLAWQARELVQQDEKKREEAHRLLERAQARAGLGIVFLQHARLLATETPRQSIELARRAAHANPALVEAYFQMGEGYLLIDDNPAAEKVLRQVVERDPAYGLAWSKLALALLSQHRAVEALEFAERAIGRSDDLFFTQSVRGDCYYELGKFEEAAQAYEEALNVFHHDHWTLHQAANAYLEMGNYPRAADFYQMAMENNPDSCHQTLADFADLKRKMGRVGDAVRLYKEAIKMAPDEPVYRDLLREVQKDLREAPN